MPFADFINDPRIAPALALAERYFTYAAGSQTRSYIGCCLKNTIEDLIKLHSEFVRQITTEFTKNIPTKIQSNHALFLAALFQQLALDMTGVKFADVRMKAKLYRWAAFCFAVLDFQDDADRCNKKITISQHNPYATTAVTSNKPRM